MTTLLIIGVIIVAGIAYLNRPLPISPSVQLVLDDMKDYGQWYRWGDLHFVHKDTGIDVQLMSYSDTLILRVPDPARQAEIFGKNDKLTNTLVMCLTKERVPVNRTERSKLKTGLYTLDKQYQTLDERRRKGLLTDALSTGDDIVEKFLDE